MPYKLIPPTEDTATPTAATSKKRYRLVEPAPETEVGPKGDRLDAKPLTWKETADDYSNAVGSGLTQGAIHLGGQFGDARELQKDVIRWGGNKLGVAPETSESVANFAQYLNPLTAFAPTSEQLTPEDAKAGLQYDPKSTGAHWVKTGAEILPGMLAGPGGLVRKGIQIGATTAGTELAGPWGGMAAAVLSSGKAPKSAVKLTGELAEEAAKKAGKAVPDFAAIDAEKRATYDILENAGIIYDESAFGNFANKVGLEIGKKLDPTLMPNSSAVVGKIMQLAEGRAGATWDELDTLRKNAGLAGRLSVRAGNDADAAFANSIRSHLDEFAENAPLRTNGLPEEQVFPLAQKARELASRTIKAREIEEMRVNAKGYLSGEESGIRNQMGRILKTPGGRHGWSDVELQGVRDATQGNMGRNIVGSVGRGGVGKDVRAFLGPGITGTLGGALGTMFGPVGTAVGSIGAVAAATAARKYAAKLTDRSVEQLVKALLAGKDVQKAAVSLSIKQKRDLLVRALIGGAVAGGE